MSLIRWAALAVVVWVVGPVVAWGEVVTVGTYNVENWREHFVAHKLRDVKLLPEPEANKELLASLRAANDEDNWEVSRVILDPGFFPDVIVFQEAAEKSDLEYFNKRWLEGKYETVHQFPTNTTRSQHLAMFLKPGFKVVEFREEYYKEVDPDPRGREGTLGGGAGGEDGPAPGHQKDNNQGPAEIRLFARGPGFAKVRTPGGREMWVGTTHAKSKSGNSLDVTRWRNREAVRTHAILKELAATGTPVVLLGDFNDELGVQEFEANAGGSSVENVVGEAADGLVLLTRPLAEKGELSFMGYYRPRFRSFIDHAIASGDLAKAATEVKVLRTPWAEVASDHMPVRVTFDLDRLAAPALSTPPAQKP